MKTNKQLITGLALAAGIGLSASAQGAVTQVEGAAGGGIVPWALLSGGNPTASFTWVNTGDYNLTSLAVHGTLMGRIELSYARQSFDLVADGVRDTVYTLGHRDSSVDVDVLGAKVKLMDMSDGLPALAIGIQHKRTNLDKKVLSAIGSGDDSGTDIYLAATKVFPAGSKKLLLNGTLRYTKANQIGILGFGGSGAGNDDDFSLQFEGSAGVFVSGNTVLGAEYRSKPDNLKGFKEQDWWDIFIAYLPNKNWSVVAAYANLGDIIAEAGSSDEGEGQRGLYVQIQANF